MPHQANPTTTAGRKVARPYDPAADIVRPRHIREATGLSATSIWRMRQRGDFPEPIRLSEGAVGWLRADIVAWLASRGRTGA